eukprot:CAMPEP_0114558364 /NCGR_PEP_ID=MMETSP0114-20121206/10340_1 /TAXON_ID=31324 /ORGANISM="Goniomonas sp, Strain m" /LENGTH=140 /DNA_ID=CAMNT_0001743745 /DNA_START=70 /DNA_END=492 /DNA_ORIENTATION=-
MNPYQCPQYGQGFPYGQPVMGHPLGVRGNQYPQGYPQGYAQGYPVSPHGSTKPNPYSRQSSVSQRSQRSVEMENELLRQEIARISMTKPRRQRSHRSRYGGGGETTQVIHVYHGEPKKKKRVGGTAAALLGGVLLGGLLF